MLNEMQGRLQRRAAHYWRNKHGAEVDFVIPGRGSEGPVAIECKWKGDSFEPASLAAFRRLYPAGASFVVAADIDTPYRRSFDGFDAEFVSLDQLIDRISTLTARRPDGSRGG